MIKQIITETKLILSENFGIDKCSLKDDLIDSENLAFDSLDRIDFIMLLEQRFKISINDFTRQRT